MSIKMLAEMFYSRNYDLQVADDISRSICNGNRRN
jgi:hypothetical protein